MTTTSANTETTANTENLFIDENGARFYAVPVEDSHLVQVLNEEGYPAQSIMATNWPDDSQLSTRYEHIEGIYITREEAARVSMPIHTVNF